MQRVARVCQRQLSYLCGIVLLYIVYCVLYVIVLYMGEGGI